MRCLRQSIVLQQPLALGSHFWALSMVAASFGAPRQEAAIFICALLGTSGPNLSKDMEEFLQRAKSKLPIELLRGSVIICGGTGFSGHRYTPFVFAVHLVVFPGTSFPEWLSWWLNRSKRLEKVHVVIGHKSCDLDSLISAFTYAYFLDKVSPPGVLCLPVLNIPRTEFNYFAETRFILEELSISDSFHIFRDEINLHQLNDEGKLSITLVGSNVLASEDKTLESAVVKVINPVEQSDVALEFRESSSSLVVKEILQEAPELITEQLAHLLRGSILFNWMTMDSDKVSEKQEEILSILEEKYPNLPPREDIISILQETQYSAQGLSIEQTMLKDLKELSDGEIKVAISTVNMTLEVRMRIHFQQ
ncbi:Protein prune-2 [Galemys pyrenaicus]|uniref:Protein prune-2 n=1 Tax=Galemys pyrenaicus TaxID=202257 RepID=A0A8J6AF03_GALPY|nr:Protein prune-2 [Galemys pyrenaicus]